MIVVVTGYGGCAMEAGGGGNWLVAVVDCCGDG